MDIIAFGPGEEKTEKDCRCHEQPASTPRQKQSGRLYAMSDSPISLPKPFADTLCLYCYSPYRMSVYIYMFIFLFYSLALLWWRAELCKKLNLEIRLPRPWHVVHILFTTFTVCFKDYPLLLSISKSPNGTLASQRCRKYVLAVKCRDVPKTNHEPTTIIPCDG